MEQDFLKDLGLLGVTARIKRLSDSLFYSIKELYKSQGIDIEPGWHLVLLILKEKKRVSMIEIAEMLNLSKPAVTKMINKMQGMGYVIIVSDKNDARKKMLELSEKAKRELPGFGKVWKAGQKAVQQILEGNPHFMDSLSAFEKNQSEESFSERAIKNLKK